MLNRLSSSVRAAAALMSLSAASLIPDTRRSEANRMPLRKSVPAATHTPEGSDTPKVVVLVDKQTVLSEQAREELAQMQWETEGGALAGEEQHPCVKPLPRLRRYPIPVMRYAPSRVAPKRSQTRRSDLFDRGPYVRQFMARYTVPTVKTGTSRGECPHRRSRNQTRPRSHVVRSLRVARQSH